MKKDPSFLFYTKDFQSGTQDMSCEEIGVYLRLLMYQHQHGAIPENEERIMRITGIFSVSQFREIWQTVNCKFSKKDNKLFNIRLSEEIAKRAVSKHKTTAIKTFGGLMSSNKSLSDEVKQNLKHLFNADNFTTLELQLVNSSVKKWFYDTVNSLVNNIGNANENVIVNEDTDDNAVDNRKESMREKPNLVFPFDTETFREQWVVWKDYRANEDGFKYKTLTSEQAALSKLGKLSKYDEATAIAIMHESMANGWKGFFEEQQHGSTKQTSAKGVAGYSDNFKRKIAERLQSG